MHATYLKHYGPPDVLTYGELPKPQPGPGEVLVRTFAAGVNPIDWRIRSGSLRYLFPAKLPLVLGYDVSGVVAKVGKDVHRVQPGDEVYCFLNRFRGGGYAEYAVASVGALAFKPANLTYEEAAALPLAACTALQSLRDLGRIAEGQRVLVNGASGGVGIFAVQLAKVFGAEVIGVCSTRNMELVKQLGADDAIDYTSHEFTQDPRQYDIVLDAVAKSSFFACRRILKPKSCYVRTVPSPTHLLFCGLTRFSGRKRCKTIWVQRSGDDLRFLKELAEQRKLRPIIERVLPLKDARHAHELSQGGHVRGKLVLRVDRGN